MTVFGLTSGAVSGRFALKPLEKMFCAVEIAIAPPRELKKIAIALPVGISLVDKTTWTAIKGTSLLSVSFQDDNVKENSLWTPAPAPKPLNS